MSSEEAVADEESTASSSVTAAQVVSVIQRMGFECGEQDQGMTMCYNDSGENWQVRTSPTGDGDRGYVRTVCAAGAGDDGRVLTNRTTNVVYAGHPEQDLRAFQRRLASSGIELDFVDYC